MSARLSAATMQQIRDRDRTCVACPVLEPLVMPPAVTVYQFRPGDSPLNGVVLCTECRAAVERRALGIAGMPPDVHLTDGRDRCGRCRADTTGLQSGAVTFFDDVDPEDDPGQARGHVRLCLACYDAVVAAVGVWWVRPALRVAEVEGSDGAESSR